MGAWDFKAFDNDTALDFVQEIVRYIAAPLKGGAGKYSNEDMRASAQLLCILAKRGLYVDYLALAKDKLKLILDDDEWMEDWNDPVQARREIIKEINAVNRYIE